MKTVILCGGKGTRAYPHSLEVPKPLLTVAGRPVLWHVMELYAAQGFNEFVLAAGYKADMVRSFAKDLPASWSVEVVDTGEETNTGGRVIRCRDRVSDTFFVTYADGLGDVDLEALLAFHRAHDGVATLTSVPMPSQYGTLELDMTAKVRHFREKPRLPEHLINAGFFVFDQAAFDLWAGEDLEREVLPYLGDLGRLYAYRHNGFWKSMDTYKDSQELSALCGDDGHGPWIAAPRRSG